MKPNLGENQTPVRCRVRCGAMRRRAGLPHGAVGMPGGARRVTACEDADQANAGEKMVRIVFSECLMRSELAERMLRVPDSEVASSC